MHQEKVLSVHHWTDRLFSFTTTRDMALRFSNGHFTMIGLRGENGKPLLRAYSIVSANYCLLYTSPSPRDRSVSRMPSSA